MLHQNTPFMKIYGIVISTAVHKKNIYCLKYLLFVIENRAQIGRLHAVDVITSWQNFIPATSLFVSIHFAINM